MQCPLRVLRDLSGQLSRLCGSSLLFQLFRDETLSTDLVFGNAPEKIRQVGLVRIRGRLRHVGNGWRVDRLRRRRKSSRTRRRRCTRLQLFRHRLGVRRLARASACSASSCARTPTPGSIPRRRSRRRTARGRRAQTFCSTTSFRRITSVGTRRSSLENLGVDSIDLLQFHVWEDAWARDERWQRVMDDLKREGLIGGVGISVNRWEPENGIADAAHRRVDAVQVIYNIFDQAPEDELFPVCRELGYRGRSRASRSTKGRSPGPNERHSVPTGRLPPHVLRARESRPDDGSR